MGKECPVDGICEILRSDCYLKMDSVSLSELLVIISLGVAYSKDKITECETFNCPIKDRSFKKFTDMAKLALQVSGEAD